MVIKISPYLHLPLIQFLDLPTREDILESLTDILYQNNYLKNKEEFYEAILEREHLVTTGIGMGIAIPHARLPSQDDFFIAVAILRKGVDWGAIDGVPIQLVFMIGGPDDKQTEYLKILSSLTQFLKDNEHRKRLLSSKTPEEVMEIFQ